MTLVHYRGLAHEIDTTQGQQHYSNTQLRCSRTSNLSTKSSASVPLQVKGGICSLLREFRGSTLSPSYHRSNWRCRLAQHMRYTESAGTHSRLYSCLRQQARSATTRLFTIILHRYTFIQQPLFEHMPIWWRLKRKLTALCRMVSIGDGRVHICCAGKMMSTLRRA